MNIRFKVSALVLALSITSFIGFGILIVNGQQVRLIARGLTVDYEDALARESFSKFNDFLNAIQASSGISQTLGETFYGLKDTLSRQQLMDKMLYDYRTTFARELNLLGGGAFYEPYAFYPNIHDFHCFVSKELSAGSLPTERNVVWLGDEWEWDVDTYDEGWYLTALPNGWNRSSPRQDRYYWSELYVDTSVDALMVTVSLPIYSSAKIMVGVATVDISLSTLQKMVASFPLPTPSTQIAGFSVINNATFAVSGSSNYDVVEYPQGSWLNHLVDLKPGQTVNKTLNLNGKEYSLSAFVHDSGIGVALLVPNEEKFAAVDALQRASYITVISIVLVMIAVVVIVIIAISIWIVRPIKMTSLLLETFAKGDLTQVLSVNGNDELALMTRMIASAQDGIRSLIAAIGEKASILSEIGSDLASNMNITANAVNQITANVQSIKLRVQNQSAYVSQTHGTMDQLVANINKLDSHVANQSSNVSQASSAIEEMVANTRSVTDTLIKNTANVNTLREASEIGRHGLQEVAADIQEISRES
ncbi:MAG: methyl-accepting chemotaxis protein, partial [Treponema sp.]|nr:methyl-accepting chemotaxis protein [Treponema sp.]